LQDLKSEMCDIKLILDEFDIFSFLIIVRYKLTIASYKVQF